MGESRRSDVLVGVLLLLVLGLYLTPSALASDGKTLVSASGLRQYRPPSWKPNLNRYQANFERKFPGQRSRQ